MTEHDVLTSCKLKRMYGASVVGRVSGSEKGRGKGCVKGLYRHPSRSITP
jgi:hypothetical protein